MDQSNQEQNQSGQPEPEEKKPEQEQQAKQQAQGAEDQQSTAGAKDVEENRGIAYLSYLGILFLVPMLAKKESEFAQYHSKQGLVLTIGWFLGSFLIPIFGLGVLLYLVIMVFSIMGLVNVNKGEMKELPIVGDLAKKFNI